VYGWTTSKKILKAFFKQRDRRKYMAFEMSKEDVAELFSHSDLPGDTMITYIKLQSARQLDEEYTLFMTMAEMQEVEIRIQRLFQELSSVATMNFMDCSKEIFFYLRMIVNLVEKYSDALDYLGYRPQEMRSMFPPAHDDEDVESLIGLAYYDTWSCNDYYNEPCDQVPGLSVLEDVASKIIYSIESFVKVMKDDL